MSVAIDATATQSDRVIGGTTVSNTHLTIGSGSNRALLAFVAAEHNTPTSMTVVWDPTGANQALTLIQSGETGAANHQKGWLFGLVNPVSGNKTLKADWTGSDEVVLDAISVTGANQTGGSTTFPPPAAATGNSGTASVTIPSASGNLVAAIHVCGTAAGVSSMSDTTIFTYSGGGNIECGANRAAGASSVSLTATLSGTDQWVSVGTDIVADAGLTLTPGAGSEVLQGLAPTIGWSIGMPSVR